MLMFQSLIKRTVIMTAKSDLQSACLLKKPFTIPLSWPVIESVRLEIEALKASERIVFFDLDNTLYSPSTGIDKLMVQRIEEYCEKLGMSRQEASDVGLKYYSTYGLAIRGFLKHHNVDPIDYDDFVDGGLPLEQKLHPSSELSAMLKQISCRKWIFTNAGLYLLF